MSFITSFVYCGETKVNGFTGQTEIIDPMQVIKTKYIPTYFTFSIACAIYGVVLKNDNTFRMRFKNSEGDILVDTGKTAIEKQKIEVDIMQINVEFRNVVLDREDIYYTEVELNDEVLGDYKIAVVKDVG